MIAVVPVRGGCLPAGGTETVAEAGGRAILVGETAVDAVEELGPIAREVTVWDTPGFAPGCWSTVLADLLRTEPLVILPASPDGRDLGPRLAAMLDRQFFSGAVELRGDIVRTIGFDGAVMIEHHMTGSAVLTLQPGVRGIDPALDHHEGAPEVTDLGCATGSTDTSAPDCTTIADCTTIEVLPPDASTMDLAEAPRILAGGNGFTDPERFEQLAVVAEALDASVGTTRVITDKGWLPHERQIGTTGVVVSPDLYVAFGISGAVQHTSGLGRPEHVISVNVDPHCPMMSLADLSVVADANATIEALAARLGHRDDPGPAVAGE